jgi:sn-glycerol 3-phosphate transport system substrate-binding protein
MPPVRCAVEPSAGTVSVWHVLGTNAAGELFEARAAEFNASQDLVRVEARSIEGGTESLLALLAETDTSNWPDIVVSQPQALRRLADSAVIVPPGECGDVEATMGSMLPVVKASYTYRDGLQAVPFGVSSPILLFDAAELRAAGLDPAQPPATLEELAAASKQIVDRGISPFGLVVYDWFGTFLINQGAAQRGELIVTPANGRDGGALTVDYATPANRDAMSWLVDVVDDGGGIFIGGIPSGLENLIRIVQPVDGGTMTIQTSGSLGDLIDILEAGSFPGVELGVGPLPGPGPGGLVGGNGFWLIDHGDPGRVRSAYTFVDWIVEPSRMAEYVVETGYAPPSFRVAAEPAVVERWSEYPQLRVAFDQLAAQTGSDEDAGAVFGPSVEIDYIFYRLTNRVLGEGMSVEQGLRDLTVDVQAELDRYELIVSADQSASP